MTGSLLFCICLAYFVVAYFLYGGFLSRLFSIDPKNPTPSETQFDGVDYVPTSKAVLFGHHFASLQDLVLLLVQSWLHILAGSQL